MENDKNLNGETQNETNNEAQNETNNEAKKAANEPKASSKAEQTSSSDKLKAKFGEYKGEFRKIIWPSRKELQKKSITVVITSLLFAALIFGIDSVYNLCIELLLRLFG